MAKKKGPCNHCGTEDSPMWRKGPPEKPDLCNACGLRFRIGKLVEDYLPKQIPNKNESTSIVQNYQVKQEEVVDDISASEEHQFWKHTIPSKKRSKIENKFDLKSFSMKLKSMQNEDDPLESDDDMLLMYDVNHHQIGSGTGTGTGSTSNVDTCASKIIGPIFIKESVAWTQEDEDELRVLISSLSDK